MRASAARHLVPHSGFRWLAVALAMAWGCVDPGRLLRVTAAEPDVLPSDPAEAGRVLALELRRQAPSESATNTATLRLRDKSGRRRSVPMTIETHVGPTGWRARYLAPQETAPTVVVEAAISHLADATPHYALRQGGEPEGQLKPAGAGAADVALAGSDFWVSDLALEFLHWPEQRVLRQESSSGRMCYVLESTQAGTNGYARVVSWVDTKYRAILNAQAFDRSRQLVKSFSTGSFRRLTRADGTEAWFLQDIKMSDRRRDSVTELSFQLPDSAK